MTRAQILFLIRTVHTIIYSIMAVSVVGILLSAIFGYVGPWLIVALIFVGMEVVVFVASGMRCPLTDLAKKYGAENGYVFDTFLPESLAKYTFRFFGLLLVFGLVGLALRAIAR
ncbi:MAG: hypothetical protein ACLQUY_17510 [Ktedonobacterales bacterium]